MIFLDDYDDERHFTHTKKNDCDGNNGDRNAGNTEFNPIDVFLLLLLFCLFMFLYFVFIKENEVCDSPLIKHIENKISASDVYIYFYFLLLNLNLGIFKCKC
jgi:hypothetical protein